MNRFEITSIASSLFSSALVFVLLYVGIVHYWSFDEKTWEMKSVRLYWALWDQTNTMMVLVGMSLLGVMTATAAAWASGQRRREAEAAAAPVGRSGSRSWGADAQEAAMSEEYQRTLLVRLMVEQLLALAIAGLGVGLLLATAPGISNWLYLTEADTVDNWILKQQREYADFPTVPMKQRMAAIVCLLAAAGSFGMAYLMRKVGAASGGTAVAADGAYHQVRGFVFLLAAGLFFGDSITTLPHDSYLRTFRWMVVLPVVLAYLGYAGWSWSALLPMVAALFGDVVLAGISGDATADRVWSPIGAWLIWGVLLWQVLEILWNAVVYRQVGSEGFYPIPSAPSQGPAELTEGRLLDWVLGGLRTNFGTEIERELANQFLIEKVGGTALASVILFCAATCVIKIEPWEVGVSERFGQLQQQQRLLLRHVDGRIETDVVVVGASSKGQLLFSVPRPGGSREVLDEAALAARGWTRDTETSIGLALRQPGFHFKFPWPIERVAIVPIGSLQEVTFGSSGHDHEESDIVMWSADHYDNEFEMVTGEKMLASVVAVMHYRVRDPAAYFNDIYPETSADLAFQDSHSSEEEIKIASAESYFEALRKDRGARHGPKALLAQVGYRALTEVVSQNSLWSLMATNRGTARIPGRAVLSSGEDIESEIKRKAQERLDELGAGLEVVRVVLTDVHPPVKEETALAYENVVAAIERRGQALNEGRTIANRELPAAKGEAGKLINDALALQLSETRRADGFAAAYRGLAGTLAAVGPTNREIALDRMISEARLRMLGRRNLVVLPPGLNFTVHMVDRRTADEQIGAQIEPVPGGIQR